VNVLLVGFGGHNHPGEYLADSIAILGTRGSGGLRVLSIPRDLAAPWPITRRGLGKVGKINQVFAVEAREGGPGRGLRAMESVLNELLGIEIRASLAMDFRGFVRLVDSLGGADVDVAVGFQARYPSSVQAGLWSKVAFNAGRQRMNGLRLLAFVRARYSTGPEGSDFARMRRQHLAIAALLERIRKGPLGILRAAVAVRGHCWWHGDWRALLYEGRSAESSMVAKSLVLSTDNVLVSITNDQLGSLLLPAGTLAELRTQLQAFLTDSIRSPRPSRIT